jgi:hypothetical protein
VRWRADVARQTTHPGLRARAATPGGIELPVSLRRTLRDRKMNKYSLLRIMTVLLGTPAMHAMAAGIDLNTGILRVRLDADSLGVPRIASAVWVDTGSIALRSGGETCSWDEWLPAPLRPATAPAAEWRLEEAPHFLRALYARPLEGNLQAYFALSWCGCWRGGRTIPDLFRMAEVSQCAPKCASKVHSKVRATGLHWHAVGMTMAFTGKRTRIP